MDVTRRYLLTRSAIALFSAGLLPSFLRRTAAALDAAPSRPKRKILVTVFLRGAADGLNVVVPDMDGEYRALRPTIAVSPPGRGDGAAAIDLDGFFGFHPSLAPLKPLYDARELAVVHAVGSPDNTRSHFDAQDYMESGTPGSKSTVDGWLNRHLQKTARSNATPFRAVAIAPRMPRTLAGPAAALTIDDLTTFRLFPGGGPRANELERRFEELYASSGDPIFTPAAREMFDAIHTLERAGFDSEPPGDGAEYPQGPLGKSLSQTARLIKADLGLEVAFVEIGGWDHHVNEGSVDGQIARSLGQLGSALAAFRRDLGERARDVLLVTMSEFGRTARENGNRGTDHGHANVMLVLGGGVRGGRIYGDWPGLRSDRLFEGRDLALTTDFRTVLSEVLERHLGLRDATQIFPGFHLPASGLRGFLA
jgi:uncharacterized protein (DUF1501 family)